MFWLGDLDEIKKGQAETKENFFKKMYWFVVATQKEGIHQRLLHYKK